MTARVIVAGGRDFNDYELLKSTLDEFFCRLDDVDIQIVCGEAKGADTLGKRYAQEHNIPVVSFPAQWDRYGKSAGYKRNVEMAGYANMLVAFWDGESKGTKNMIDTAKKFGLTSYIVRYKTELLS
jgi:hypothetical protein